MEITLAIIGTAGRMDEYKRLSKDSFKAMCIVAEALIKQLEESNYPVSHIVSGGSAWADHVAVKMFLDKTVEHLRLFIPCDFDNGSFADNEESRKYNYPAKTLNQLHTQFSRSTSINSLTEIQLAKGEGAEILPCKGGFYGRNAMVAKSDILLAMTFGVGNMVKEGGTADTVRRYLARVDKEGFFDKSFHYNLTDGKIYKGLVAPPKEENKKSNK